MIEFLSGLGIIALIYLGVTIVLLIIFFIPSVFQKQSDPSGGLLVAFLSLALIFWCIAWPVTIPMEIYNHFKKRKING